MDRKTRRLLSALNMLPVAMAPLAQAHAAVPMPPPVGQTSATWNFHHEHVLGTSLQISVRAPDATSALRAEAAALRAFDREEAILSAWRAGSEFSRWERTRLQAVPVSDELFTTLAAFDVWRERTQGALDPSVEAATRLWQRAASAGRKPASAEIAETVEAIAQPHWSLDPARRTATRLSGVPLALASFAKSRISSHAADAALSNGATGITLNVGGDVVVRGAMTQVVAIADPRRAAENDAALEHIVVTGRAVATSGSYRRGFTLAADAGARPPSFSHLIDPRTAEPVGHILSSTVIAADAETAGALATAFSVLPIEQSQALAARTPGVDFLLITSDGRSLTSAGWARYRLGGPARLHPAAYVPPARAEAGSFDPAFELVIELNLPRIEEGRYHRPYVAVWIEDDDHFPVRTLALWAQRPRWLPDLKQWYRDDQQRSATEKNDIAPTIGSATRPPGKYSLNWDGKDREGKLVKAGEYTVVIEAAREHGGYQVERRTLGFTGKPEQASLPAGQEIGGVLLDYRKR